MEFEKRVVVLKQLGKGFSADGSALTGAVYAERLGKDLSLKIQAAGLSALKEGRYVGVFSAGGKEFCFALEGRDPVKIHNAPSIKGGFSVLIAFVRGEAQPVAFGTCGAGQKGAVSLLAAIQNNGDGKEDPLKNVPIPPVEVPQISPNTPGSPLVPPVPGIPQEEPEKKDEVREPPVKEEPAQEASFREGALAYDDEAIAEEDYYDDALQEGDRNDASEGEDETGGRKKKSGKDSQKDDGTVRPFLRTKGKLTYYKKVKASLDQAFEKFPKDTRLMSVFPRSEWVRTETALLGVIYENGVPRYLCVAKEKTGEPPEDMKEHCTFVPSSPFQDKEGFYVVFQDADSGAYVTVSQS